MDLSQIKLVITDMDGTLLNSNHQISDQFFELFHQLKSDVHFVIASGRQYFSMVDKLESIKNEITIVAENGGIVKRGDLQLSFTAVNHKIIHEILPLLRNIPGAQIILAGKEAAYVESNEESFLNMFTEFYSNHKLVDNLLNVEDDLMKIAIYHPISSEQYVFPHVQHLENELQFKISGQHWLDIASPNTNKGEALSRLQNEFNISQAQTMAFGDFHNDLEMLAKAKFSFAMANAHPEIKAMSNYMTTSNDEFGVEKVLAELMEAKN